MQARKLFPTARQSTEAFKRLRRLRILSACQAVGGGSTNDEQDFGSLESNTHANGHTEEAEQGRRGRACSRRAAMCAASLTFCSALQQPRSAWADAGTLTIADVTPAIAPASPLTKRYNI